MSIYKISCFHIFIHVIVSVQILAIQWGDPHYRPRLPQAEHKMGQDPWLTQRSLPQWWWRWIKPLIGAREQLLLNWNQNSPIKLYIQCWNQENSINEERWRDRKNEMLDGWNGVCKRQGGKKLHLRLVRLEQVEQRKGWGDTGERGGRREEWELWFEGWPVLPLEIRFVAQQL